MELAFTVGLAAAPYPPDTFILGDRVEHVGSCSGFSNTALHRQRSGLQRAWPHPPGEEEPRNHLWLDPRMDGSALFAGARDTR